MGEPHQRIWIEAGDECPYFYEESELTEAGSPVTEYIRADLCHRPAPAATDTGLVTIGYVLQCNQRPFVDGEGADYNEIFRTAREPENWTATVTRSQAEAIIAANAQTIEGQRRWIAALEADNAALTARVKELETERDEALDDAKFAERIAIKREIDANASVEALEAKLAAVEKAKDAMRKAAVDYCWQRYKGRDPMNLKDPAVFTSHEWEKIGEVMDEAARAALGGKTS